MKQIGTLTILLCCLNVQAGEQVSCKAKVEATGQVLESINKIYKCARSETMSVSTSSVESVQKRVKIIVSELRTADQTAVFIRICMTLADPQTAGDESFDVWFDQASWLALDKLADFPPRDALDAFESLEKHLTLDGCLSHTFKELKESVKKKLGPEKN